MKIEISKTNTKIYEITEAPGFECITLYCTYYTPGHGKIVISHLIQAYCAEFSKMSCETIEEFFAHCTPTFLIRNLSTIQREIPADDLIIIDELTRFIEDEYCGDADKEELKEKVKSLSFKDGANDKALLRELLGECWFSHEFPMQTNPKYTSLIKLIVTIQNAFLSLDS